MMIETTGNADIDQATQELIELLVLAHRRANITWIEQDAQRLLRMIMKGTRELDHQSAVERATEGAHPVWSEAALRADQLALRTTGTRVSIPTLVPGERAEAITTGHSRIQADGDLIEVMAEGASVGLWLPVDIVSVIH